MSPDEHDYPDAGWDRPDRDEDREIDESEEVLSREYAEDYVGFEYPDQFDEPIREVESDDRDVFDEDAFAFGAAGRVVAPDRVHDVSSATRARALGGEELLARSQVEVAGTTKDAKKIDKLDRISRGPDEIDREAYFEEKDEHLHNRRKAEEISEAIDDDEWARRVALAPVRRKLRSKLDRGD